MRSRAVLLLLVCPALLEAQASGGTLEVERVLAPLVQSYGVSGMEAPVRATVDWR